MKLFSKQIIDSLYSLGWIWWLVLKWCEKKNTVGWLVAEGWCWSSVRGKHCCIYVM